MPGCDWMERRGPRRCRWLAGCASGLLGPFGEVSRVYRWDYANATTTYLGREGVSLGESAGLERKNENT